MPKVRVYEVAKKLNISSKDVIDKLKEFGVKAASHMSTLEDEEASKIIEFYTAKSKKVEEVKTEPVKVEQAKVETQVRQEIKPITEPVKKPVETQPVKQENKPQNNVNSNTNNNKPYDNNRNGQNRPAGQNNANKPAGQNNANKPAGQNYTNKPTGQNNTNRPNGQNNTNRPNGQYNSNKPNGQNKLTGQSRPNQHNQKQQNNQQAAKQEQVKEVLQIEEDDTDKTVYIPETLTVKQLADAIGKNAVEIVKNLIKSGTMIAVNQEIDFETASKIAMEYEILVEKEIPIDMVVDIFKQEEDKEEDLKERPPVVVVMGHVDHGKTSLLDSIRKTSVTAGEAGGITQHIGAYTVQINGKNIAFLDTPGHEAFTAMRMRGAQVTDIAILVVAADDGVMPQTIEAINHAKAAGVDIIVAINKIDKPSANPDRVKQELVEHGLLSEDWGGETICVPVSAVSKEGIDTLLEMVILVSEMKELRANPNKGARGTVIEAKLEKGRGTVTSVLIQEGTLRIGDPIVCGNTYGKLRAMTDDKGRRLKEAGPSTPVEILGLSEVPQAGDKLYVAQNEKQARQVAEYVYAKGRVELIKSTPQKVSLDDLFTQIQLGNVKDLNIIIKADVQGSVEAVRQSLEKLSNEEVRVKTLHGGVGAITESDVMLASTSSAIIIGFNVRPEVAAKSMADEQKVDVRLYRIIYNAIEDIAFAMKGMLAPIYQEKVIGHAVVRQTFKASGVGTIAGSYITDGKFIRSAKVRVMRGGAVVFEGELESLKRFKDDVKEVLTGFECGLLFKKFNDIREEDTVEAFVMEEIKR